jgi:hypothetical protein
LAGNEVLFILLSEVDLDFSVEFGQVLRAAAQVAEKLGKINIKKTIARIASYFQRPIF